MGLVVGVQVAHFRLPAEQVLLVARPDCESLKRPVEVSDTEGRSIAPAQERLKVHWLGLELFQKVKRKVETWPLATTAKSLRVKLSNPFSLDRQPSELAIEQPEPLLGRRQCSPRPLSLQAVFDVQLRLDRPRQRKPRRVERTQHSLAWAEFGRRESEQPETHTESVEQVARAYTPLPPCLQLRLSPPQLLRLE